MIYKIDRIVTIEEALLCEEHKVPYIGVCLDMSEAICQPVHLRKVNIEQALEIRSRLSSTKVVFELPILKMTKSHFQFLRDYEIDYVQLFFNVGLEEKDLQNLREASIQLFITGQDIGPDDDPTWLIPPFLEANIESNIQLDIYPYSYHPWEQFLGAAAKYPECLQTHEIEAIAKNYNLILGTNFTVENVKEISQTFPSVKGLFFSIEGEISSTTGNCHKLSEILEIIKKVSTT